MPKLAFLLQTHDANPHLERLCATLSAFPDSRVFCHHDFSKSDAHIALKRVATFCSPHRVTAWSTVPVALAEMDLFKLAFQNDQYAEWFILLSGNCYPAKSIRYILNFLSQTSHNGFMDTHLATRVRGLSGWWWKRVFTRPIGRIPFISRHGRFYRREIRVRRLKTPFSEGQPLRFGANWIMLRRNAVETLLSKTPHEHAILQFFSKAEEKEQSHMSPEECLVQSLFGDPSQHGISPNYLRYIDWEHAVNWHPNTLVERHWDAILSSGALFARKFEAEPSRSLLDQLDKEIVFA